MRPKIYLAIVTRGKLDFELVNWLLGELSTSVNSNCSYEIPTVDISADKPLNVNANNVVKKFLASDCDRLLMLDDDITPPKNTVSMLFNSDKEIIGARVLFSQPEFTGPMSCAGIFDGPNKPYKLVDSLDNLDKVDPVFPVDFIGFACVMIKRSVFDKIKAPWFKQKYSKDGSKLLKGMDTKFCERARAKKIGIFCDLRLLTGQKVERNLAEEVKRMLELQKRVRDEHS